MSAILHNFEGRARGACAQRFQGSAERSPRWKQPLARVPIMAK